VQRLLSSTGTTIAVARHPGFAATELMRHLPAAVAFPAPLFSQEAAMGALATLRAATDPGVLGGEEYAALAENNRRSHPPATAACSNGPGLLEQHRRRRRPARIHRSDLTNLYSVRHGVQGIACTDRPNRTGHGDNA
jgi:hypothetical protein